ncbi:MAG: hypothetical protein CMB77_03945 [Euryarchaeota archaeon]|nr:hypothetical protein [Euryarchaeota archaeon]|tara:strand:+ start:29207 stop:29830 length:624 start_codon:yes stop_codon:yes gene_type:complete
MGLKKEVTINDIITALFNGRVVYELQGTSAYFGYDVGGSAFFLEEKLQTRIEGLENDYLRVVRAIFRCINIDTINPRSIWLKCRIESPLKIIQVIDIGSTGISLTKKKCLNFLGRIDGINYGHFHIVKNPGAYIGSATDFVALLEDDLDLSAKISDLPNDTRKKLFQKLEKFLLLNGRSRIPDWDISKCRSILIETANESVRIFRRH